MLNNTKFIKFLLNNYSKGLFFTYFLFVVDVVYLVFVPTLNGFTTNEIITNKNYNLGVGALLVYWLFYCVFSYLKQRYDTRLFSSLSQDLSRRVITKHITKNSDNSLIVAHTDLVQQFRSFLEHDLMGIIRSFLEFIISLILLLLLDYKMGLMSVVSLPIVYFISIHFVAKISKSYKQKYILYEQQLDIISSKNLDSVNDYLQQTKNLEVQISDLSAFSYRSSYMMSMIFIMLGFWIYANNPNLQLANLVASLGYLYNIFWAITSISFYLNTISSLKETANRINLELPDILE